MTDEELKALNGRFERTQPVDIIRWAVETFRPDVALTSSFGADSAALIHMALQADPRLSIRTVDTGFLFPETLRFTEELRRRWNLNLTVFRTTLPQRDVERLRREHATGRPGGDRDCCGEGKGGGTQGGGGGPR